MGPGAALPIGPCGGWGFGLYLDWESLTDTDICGFIGLTLYFKCPLKAESACKRPYQGKCCVKVRVTATRFMVLSISQHIKTPSHTHASVLAHTQLTCERCMHLHCRWHVATCWWCDSNASSLYLSHVWTAHSARVIDALNGAHPTIPNKSQNH